MLGSHSNTDNDNIDIAEYDLKSKGLMMNYLFKIMQTDKSSIIHKVYNMLRNK